MFFGKSVRIECSDFLIGTFGNNDELWRCVWKVEVTNENGIKSFKGLFLVSFFFPKFIFKTLCMYVCIIWSSTSRSLVVYGGLQAHSYYICAKISLKFFLVKNNKDFVASPLSSDAANKSMIYDLNQVCVYCVFFSSKFVFCFQVKKEKVLKVPAGYISQFHLSKTLSARVFFTKIWLDITIFKVSTYAEELHILLAVL